MSDPAVLAALKQRTPLYYENPHRRNTADCALPFSRADIEDAERRLRRFAPLIARLFPETKDSGGIIESPLTEIPAMREAIVPDGNFRGRLFLKEDSMLPVAGSVKARGGIYEVLCHTEELALQAGILRPEDDYSILADHRDFFSQYTVAVGSTGNLGLSIGIMSAALGYHAVVHMSCDAKEWKKQLLREKGVTVCEYAGDYGSAVAAGRARSESDPMSYFVDDENSASLFLGYSVAALRLKAQLEEMGIPVDGTHPLTVIIPCGVGGAPGGITFGLRTVFGDHAHCYFAEPTEAPCMLLGLASGKFNKISVQDIGLTGRTEADGLAVGRCSGLVSPMMDVLLDGLFTVSDEELLQDMRTLWHTEHIFVEPSAAAGFCLPRRLSLPAPQSDSTVIVWATGGRLVPEEIRAQLLDPGEK